MTEDIEKLNIYKIDWCFNCAIEACKSDKQKMFAWIVIQLLRSMSDLGTFTYNGHLQFLLNIAPFKENEAISKFLFKKKYWNFLKEIVYTHLITYFKISNNGQVKAAANPKIKFLNEEHNTVCLEYSL